MGNVVSGATPATASSSALEALVSEMPEYRSSHLMSNTRCVMPNLASAPSLRVLLMMRPQISQDNARSGEPPVARCKDLCDTA